MYWKHKTMFEYKSNVLFSNKWVQIQSTSLEKEIMYHV